MQKAKALKDPWLILGALLMLATAVLFWQHFAVLNYTSLNSDHAMHVLMAENLHLPKGFYFLGQNRLGSLIPMLAFTGVQLGLSPMWAATFTQIAILVCTLLLVAQLLPRKRLALWFSPILFLPVYPFHMQVMVGHPYLAQHLFSLLFLYLYYKKVNQGRGLWALLFALTGFLALWSSELAVATMGGWALVEHKRIFNKLKGKWLLTALGAILGLCFVLMAKNNSRKADPYNQILATPSEAWHGFKSLLQALGQMLLFQTNKPFNAVFIYVIIAVVIFLVVSAFRKKEKLSRITYVFLATAVFSLLAVLVSNWSVKMGAPLRYYAPAYLFFMLFLVSALSDTYPHKQWKLYLPLTVLALAVVCCSYLYVTTFTLRVKGRMTVQSAEKIYQQIRPLVPAKKFAIMGTYWNTYLIDALYPDLVGAPCFSYQMRHWFFLEEALKCEFIVMVGNGWLEELPPRLERYGYHFTKESPTFKKQEIYYALYRKVD
jgi:hypothetical protein